MCWRNCLTRPSVFGSCVFGAASWPCVAPQDDEHVVVAGREGHQTTQTTHQSRTPQNQSALCHPPPPPPHRHQACHERCCGVTACGAAACVGAARARSGALLIFRAALSPSESASAHGDAVQRPSSSLLDHRVPRCFVGGSCPHDVGEVRPPPCLFSCGAAPAFAFVWAQPCLSEDASPSPRLPFSQGGACCFLPHCHCHYRCPPRVHGLADGGLRDDAALGLGVAAGTGFGPGTARTPVAGPDCACCALAVARSPGPLPPSLAWPPAVAAP